MIVVATTLAAFAMDDPDTWGSWLKNASTIAACEDDVRYFAALETDARGDAPFDPLRLALADMASMEGISSDVWTFSLDDGRESITTANRLRHITVGQNLATDYALSHQDCTHMLFLAADLEPPPDCLPKLLELDHPLVGGHVPTYCLDGPSVQWHDRFGDDTDGDVRMHMASAAFILIRRDLLRFVRWRWDLDAGMSDDPCLHHDARTFHGVETLVRHDVVGRHHPEAIGPIETRFPDADMRVYREGEGGSPDPAWVDQRS